MNANPYRAEEGERAPRSRRAHLAIRYSVGVLVGMVGSVITWFGVAGIGATVIDNFSPAQSSPQAAAWIANAELAVNAALVVACCILWYGIWAWCSRR